MKCIGVQDFARGQFLRTARGIADRHSRIEDTKPRQFCLKLIDDLIVRSSTLLNITSSHPWSAVSCGKSDRPEKAIGRALECRHFTYVDNLRCRLQRTYQL